jgi:hypothetical protein
MLSILLSWLHLGWLSLVFGLAGFKLVAGYYKEENSTLPGKAADYVIVLGFLIISVLLSFISIFRPIDIFVNVVFILLGVILTVKLYPDISRLRVDIIGRWRAMNLSLKAAILIIFSATLLGTVFEDVSHTDAKLYHLQAIEWIKNYHVVPGLGNLYGRLAFNSHYFIPSAFFSVQISETRVLLPIFSFFFFILCVRILINISAALQKRDWFYLLLNSTIFLFFTYQTIHHLRSVSTDDITCVLIFMVFFLFWESAFQPGKKIELFLIWIMIFSALTFKLSSMFVLVLAAFTLFPLSKRKLGLFFATGLIIVSPFIYRNTVLSGYLLYPVPELDVLGVDWKVPKDLVVFEKEVIEGWARLPNPPAPEEEAIKLLEMPFWEWLEAWWTNRPTLRWKAIYLANLFSIVLLIIAIFRKDFRTAVLFFTILFNLAFWFYKAPDPRFAYAFLYFNLGLVGAYTFTPLFKLMDVKLYSGTILIFAFFLVGLLVFKKEIEYNANRDLSLLLFPGSHQNDEIEEFKGENFSMNVPANGSILCFTSPLPCTPYPKKHLMMRGSDYQAGFRIIQKE